MSSNPNPEPDDRGRTLYVGQDQVGHWLVQDNGRKIGGRFVSRRAALNFARGACQLHHAIPEMAGVAADFVDPLPAPLRKSPTRLPAQPEGATA